jgi:glycine cleavage system transcriptional repressor
MNHFALTIVGRDRAGIVSQVTKILFDLGCNIADSSCSILGGQFAMILILGHPELTDRDSFGDAFKPLEDSDLSVALRVLKPGGEIRTNIFGDICMISVYGSDKPGIVYRQIHSGFWIRFRSGRHRCCNGRCIKGRRL